MATLLERKRAIEAAKAAKLAEEERQRKEAEARRHPLLKRGASRSVRDAYFLGLVFAAFANDEEMDAGEERLLRDIGSALEMPLADIDESIKALRDCGNDEAGIERKLALIESCVKSLEKADFFKLFWEDFQKVLKTGSDNVEDLESFKADFFKWAKVSKTNKTERREKTIRKPKEDVDDGAEGFGSFGELLEVMSKKRYADATEISLEAFRDMLESIRPFAQWPVNLRTIVNEMFVGLKKYRLMPHEATIRLYCVIILWGLKAGVDGGKEVGRKLETLETWLNHDWDLDDYNSLFVEFVRDEMEELA